MSVKVQKTLKEDKVLKELQADALADALEVVITCDMDTAATLMFVLNQIGGTGKYRDCCTKLLTELNDSMVVSLNRKDFKVFSYDSNGHKHAPNIYINDDF